MDTLYYAPGTGGDVVALDCSVVASGAAPDLRSYAYDYELGSFGVQSVITGARKAEITVHARKTSADALVSALARDAGATVPGTITLLGWSQRCLVPEIEVSKVYKGHVKLSLTMLLLDGWWWREKGRYFPRGTSSGGIDLPTDPPHDYGHESGRAVITNAADVAAPLCITYWGPCVNPYVLIGDNRHQVNVEVRTGSTLVLDALGPRKAVTLEDVSGSRTNVFSATVREDGAQAFDSLPAGDSEITWSGAFAFRVDWRERRAAPPWVQ